MVLRHLCPQYSRDWFVFTETFTGRQGRNKYRLYVPQIFSSIGKKTVFVIVVWLFGIICPLICVALIVFQISRHHLKDCFVRNNLLFFCLFCFVSVSFVVALFISVL